MSGNISLGRVFGIPLRINYTWFIIFAWVTFSLVFYDANQTYPIGQRIILGILTSLLFFASIITHELAHSILAVRNNIPVKEITLFVFGGVSQITKEATHPRAELSIAIVGPFDQPSSGWYFLRIASFTGWNPSNPGLRFNVVASLDKCTFGCI